MLPGSAPPTSAWCARVDGEAERGARDERHVGEVRAAGVRVVEDEDVVRARVVPHDGGDRVRHRAEVDGDVLGLRDHPAALVEERRRAVAPLLDVRRERRADEHRAHLLGDRAQRAAENLELDVHGLVTHRVSRHVSPSLTPTHPGAASRSSRPVRARAGPARSRGPPAGGSSGGPGRTSAVRTATSSIAPLAVGVAVALLVRAVERLGEIACRAARSARTTGRA